MGLGHRLKEFATSRHGSLDVAPFPHGKAANSSPFVDPNLFRARRAAICGTRDGNYDVIRRVLDTQLGVRTRTTFDWDKLPERLAACALDFDFAIVDTHGLRDAEDVVDFGFRLRRLAPSLPLIFLSWDVRVNDFSCERRAMCDVTLRAPVSEPSLLLGVQAALANNGLYVDRMAQLA